MNGEARHTPATTRAWPDAGAPAVTYDDLDRATLDRQLSPSQTAKDPWGVLGRHEAVTQALVTGPGLIVTRDLPYGPRLRQRLDLFVPGSRAPRPCLVWFHGGFWQEGSKAGSGYAVPALAPTGWAVAGVGYTLTPEVRLRDIVHEAAAAVLWLQQQAPHHGLNAAHLVVGGHSAGAHLAAALAAGCGGGDAAAALAGVVLVSGVYDLAPVAASYVNDRAGIDDAEAIDLSLLRRRLTRDVPVHLLVGADEPEQFQRQTSALASAWRPMSARLTQARVLGRDHFDVLDELADPLSPTFRALLEMAP